MKKAYGFIEMLGLASAVVAVDTALKAANVELDGLEPAKGAGMHTLKITGEVSSVKAAVSSILGERSLQGKVFAHTVIARPSDGLEAMIDGGKDDLVTKNRHDNEKEAQHEDNRAPEKSETEMAAESASPVEDTEEEDSGDADISEASPELPQTEASASVEAEEVYEANEEMEEEPVPQEPGPSSPEGVEAPMEEAPVTDEPEGKSRRGKDKSVTCNICLDPKCTRLKGEPHAKCIHYKEKE